MSDFPVIDRLRSGLIVSCQAPPTSPLHDPAVITAIAQACVNQGAAGLRLDTPAHIRAVRQAIPNIPIIGLWKQTLPGSSVYITPQYHHAEAVAEAGADIIALDCTLRDRPAGEDVSVIIDRVRHDLKKAVMADVDTLGAAALANAAGADLIGTTLFGYTEATQGQYPPGLDLLRDIIAHFDCLAICEGGIASPSMARRALGLGAFAVVVGTAITGIDLQVQEYCHAIRHPR
ncbi:MAG: N-acetylmannosamine-6-phosphate 2-epimerase [Prochlorothrix sp.]